MGFVTVRDGVVVDGDGAPLQLRGMGLGNWLLAEGYMWKLSPGRESAREIEALIDELVGAQRASEFWSDFRDRFITAADIDRIAAEGMDHVRLPINWRIVMEPDGAIRSDGFEHIDALIGWCRDAGIRVLLDLHGAPGGQTGTNIDDSLGKPELFMSEHYADLTEKLWVAMAQRYRDEPVVLGYDLLNEPIPDEWQHRYADELIALYKRLTAAIRAVDDRHLLMYEGSHWATNWSIFTEAWDENSVLQFHKYWSPPDRPSIQQFIDVGERLGLPIYMGEGGENNTDWFATAFQMYEDLGIGWCFWPWKKIDTRTSPCSINAPDGWDAIVEYANGRGALPSPDDAWQTLQELTIAGTIERCDYSSEVMNALIRRAPISLPATAFGFCGSGVSYSSHNGASILEAFRSDDGVRIELGDNAELPAFDQTDGAPDVDLVVHLPEEAWVSYSIEILAGNIDITITADEVSSPPLVHVGGSEVHLDSSHAGVHKYHVESLTPGTLKVRVAADMGGLRFRRLDVKPQEG